MDRFTWHVNIGTASNIDIFFGTLSMWTWQCLPIYLAINSQLLNLETYSALQCHNIGLCMCPLKNGFPSYMNTGKRQACEIFTFILFPFPFPLLFPSLLPFFPFYKTCNLHL